MSRSTQRAGTWILDNMAYISILDYDEEDDDGFMFKRVKKKPEHKPTEKESDIAQVKVDAPKPQHAQPDREDIPEDEETVTKPKPRRKRLSFSTPKPPKDEPPPRRSKRLSKDNEHEDGSPVKKAVRKEPPKKQSAQRPERPTKQSPEKQIEQQPESRARASPKEQPEQHPESRAKVSPKKPLKESPREEVEQQLRQDTQDDHPTETVPTLQESRSATKIALPFADTPVIKRNKAMREGKSDKGESRRSSMGNRGRRASSLIESGNSNGKDDKPTT